jgi:hypothetical protein
MRLVAQAKEDTIAVQAKKCAATPQTHLAAHSRIQTTFKYHEIGGHGMM